MKVYSVSFGRDGEPGSIDRIYLSPDSAIAHKKFIESQSWAATYWVEVEGHEVES